MSSHYIDFLNRIDRFNRFDTRQTKIYKDRVNPLVELEEAEFKKKYRFSKANMRKLINIVRSDLEGDKRGGHIPIDIQVMAAIRYWGRNEIQDDSADIHGFSQSTMSNISAKVAHAFASKSRTYIKMPSSTSAQVAVMDGFKRIRGFPYVIGAIDCTHIRIQKQTGETGQYYINRKGYYSINTQVVCDHHLKITDIVAHWRGSTHDSRIFNESRIKERLESGEFQGRLLGDGGYRCTNHLYTPVLNPSSTGESDYNVAHISTRNTIERTFGVWKSRFRILLNGIRGSLENVKTTIVALAVLHNLAIEYEQELDDDILYESSETTTSPESTQQEYLTSPNTRRSFIMTHFPNR